ncbi:MAG: anhydro-N-acetylmuramic acid kinase [Clostridia bacterium]|nr:anhydro-N-acetylmuramic acid kinase [Clostridia bacterium]
MLILDKEERIGVGLMSGTSADGIDAALVKLSGDSHVELLAYHEEKFSKEDRERIFDLFDCEKATVRLAGAMNFRLGQLFADAALHVIEKAGMKPEDVDFIASHGQTIWHSPDGEDGVPYTVQIGEGAVIAEKTGIMTISDFRVADVAAHGQGAPLVPWSETKLYSRKDETVLLQNIGGIGNMTVLPAGRAEKTFAFDTGPGNMIIDAAINLLTDGKLQYDDHGACAKEGKVCFGLLNVWLQDDYYRLPLPKSTGRERFGLQYTKRLLRDAKENGLTMADTLATMTMLTAKSIADGYERYVHGQYPAKQLIVGGGGSHNDTMLSMLRDLFSCHGIAVCTQEDLGFSSEAKEAVAFAMMGDCCLRGESNTLPLVTGADHAVIMGKISLPPVL